MQLLDSCGHTAELLPSTVSIIGRLKYPVTEEQDRRCQTDTPQILPAHLGSDQRNKKKKKKPQDKEADVRLAVARGRPRGSTFTSLIQQHNRNISQVAGAAMGQHLNQTVVNQKTDLSCSQTRWALLPPLFLADNGVVK